MYVSYDPAAGATYVRLAEGSVAETRLVGDLVAVDLDDSGVPVGVELLMLPSRIDTQVLDRLVDAHPELGPLLDTTAWLRLG